MLLWSNGKNPSRGGELQKTDVSKGISGNYRVVKLTWLLKYLLDLNISQEKQKKYIFILIKENVLKTKDNVWCYFNSHSYCSLTFPFKNIKLEHFTF